MFALFSLTFQQEVSIVPSWETFWICNSSKAPKTSAMLRYMPALVPGLPPPRCVLLHPAQRGQPVQLAHQLRQVRTLCYLSPGDHPCSCYRGTMLPLSRYDDVRTEESMNLEDCYQHCKVTITNSVLLLRKHFRVVKLNILFPGCRQSQVRGPG